MTDAALVAVVAFLCLVIAYDRHTIVRVHNEANSRLQEANRVLLNAVMARTPRDFGLLTKLTDQQNRPTEKPATTMTEAEYQKWVQDDLEAMGLNPDLDMPLRPHGL